MKGPCMCGADDCIRCHPGNFYEGRYIGEVRCPKCGDWWQPTELDPERDGWDVCEECEEKGEEK